MSVDIAAENLLPFDLPDCAVELQIDHHAGNRQFGLQAFVDASAAACGEIIFGLLELLGVSPDARMAEAIYIAVSTDTGCFAYGNTTSNTHAVAAALMATGIDYHTVNKVFFRTKSRKRMQLEGRLVQEMELAQGGTLAFAYVTLALIADLQATEEDLEDISSFIGQVEGVDNAVTIRQLSPQECKISLRTDGKTLNASAVCALHGGGGHPAAAGCTIWGTPAQAKAAMLAAIEQVQHG